MLMLPAQVGSCLSVVLCLIESSEWIQKWDHIFQYNCVGMYHVLDGRTVAVFWIIHYTYLVLTTYAFCWEKIQCRNLTH